MRYVRTLALATAAGIGMTAAVVESGAILTDLTSQLILLPLPAGATLSTALGAAVGTDGLAVVVGYAGFSSGLQRPYLWLETEPDAYSDPPILLEEGELDGGGRAQAVTIDTDFGIVITGSVTQGLIEAPCAWQDDGGGGYPLVILDSSGSDGRGNSVGKFGVASVASAAGPATALAVGGFVNAGGGSMLPTVWVSPGGGLWAKEDLPLIPGGTEGAVEDLGVFEGNDRIAVGFANNGPRRKAVYWTYSRQSQSWALPIPFPTDGFMGVVRHSWATGLTLTNAAGTAGAVAGWVEDNSGVRHAYAWKTSNSGAVWSQIDLGTVVLADESEAYDLTARDPTAGDILVVGRTFVDPADSLDGEAAIWMEDSVNTSDPLYANLNDTVANVAGLPAGTTLRHASHVADRTHNGNFGKGPLRIVGGYTFDTPIAGVSQRRAFVLREKSGLRADPAPAKCRVISVGVENIPSPLAGTIGDSYAIMVRLVDLPDFATANGEIRWAGPTETVAEGPTGGSLIVSQTRCTQYLMDWATELDGAFLHIYGVDIAPGSTYELRRAPAGCEGLLCASDALRVKTGKWGDVIAPFGTPLDPDYGDIMSLVKKFQSRPDAPSKSRAMLCGESLDFSLNVGFDQISACAEAFKGKRYTQTCMPEPVGPQACP